MRAALPDVGRPKGGRGDWVTGQALDLSGRRVFRFGAIDLGMIKPSHEFADLLLGLRPYPAAIPELSDEVTIAERLLPQSSSADSRPLHESFDVLEKCHERTSKV